MHDPMTLLWEFPQDIFKKGKYRRSIFEIWHHDPSDYDSTTCKWPCWNPKHMEFTFTPWKRFWNKIFQRCAGCGGPSTKKNPVNHSTGWNDDKYPFWYSRPHIYHESCIRKYDARITSLLNNGRREGYERGYKDGHFELANGTGYKVPQEWRY